MSVDPPIAQPLVTPTAPPLLPARLRRWLTLAGLAVLIPYLLYSLHALLFRQWIIDDAGISFVYAQNLAQGYGLVVQPGAAPVEGFSNFTWTVLLAPFFALRLFDPLLTPKLISAALVLAAFILIYQALALAAPRRPAVGFLALALLAANASFVIWTTSGLENPLYVCLLAGLGYGTLRWPALPPRAAALLGGLAALLAMTRPDGLLFAAVFPAYLGLLFLARRAGPLPAALRAGVLYLLGFALLYGAFVAFRMAYFGDFFPNTYYAKGGPSAASLWGLLTFQDQFLVKARGLMEGLAGPLVAGAVAAATFYLLGARRFTRAHLAWLLCLLASAAVYLLLPADWMGEYRFATPFLVFFYAYAVSLGAALLPSLALPPRLKQPALVLAVTLLVGAQAAFYLPRSLKFAQAPTAPFATVAAFGDKMTGYAERLGLADASLLLPDIGGVLYYTDFRVYDLAGLTDKTIAQTLGRDPAALYDYVFDSLQPTFIHTHSFWSVLAYLEQDPRFRRDYIAINEYDDDWARVNSGVARRSGQFVRRDAVSRVLPVLFALRAENDQGDASYEAFLAAEGYPPPPTAAELLPLTRVNVDLGGLAGVLGYALSAPTVRPGAAVTLTVYWDPRANTAQPYTVFVHLLDPAAGSLAQVDTFPLHGRYATTFWIPERPFLDTYVLQVPETAPASAAAQVVFGLYDAQTLERLPVTDTATGRAAPEAWVASGPLSVVP